MIELVFSETEPESENSTNGIRSMNSLDFDRIEDLAFMARSGSEAAKEELAEKFRPFILSVAGKYNFHGYDFDDKVSECYSTLFKCIKLYKPKMHRFVAYAVVAIKTSMKYLGRTLARRDSSEGASALVLNDCLENILADESFYFEDDLFNRVFIRKLKKAILNLKEEETEMIQHIYMKGNIIRSYADYKGITYGAAVHFKNRVLKKLRNVIDQEEYNLFIS
ncbi:MAG: sigma-70 family RNA polymerase sigma factor [Clostridiaceae bacterium]